jgi:hypothetical protein
LKLSVAGGDDGASAGVATSAARVLAARRLAVPIGCVQAASAAQVRTVVTERFMGAELTPCA